MRLILLLAIATVVFTGCAPVSGSPQASATPWRITPRSHPVRLEISTGCPGTLDGNVDDVSNQGAGLDSRLVPDKPVKGMICRYAPLPNSAAGKLTLYRHTALHRSQASNLGSVINGVGTAAPPGVSSCFASAGLVASVIVFSYGDRSDVDLWYREDGCPFLDNGVIGAWEFGNSPFYGKFVPLIDELAPNTLPTSSNSRKRARVVG